MSTPPTRYRLVRKLENGEYVPITDDELGGVSTAELDAAVADRAIVDEDGNLRDPATGNLIPVVRSGAIAAGTATPSDLPDGSIYVKTDSGVTAELYLTAGAAFGQVLTLSSPPSALAPNQVAALVVGGVTTEVYIGASA